MITCWYYKKVIARSLDETQGLPAGAAQHVNDCPGCRHFYEVERALTRQLTAGAQLHVQLPPPFLRAKIMAALHRRPQTDVPSRRLIPAVWATALVIVSAGFFLFIRDSQHPEARRPSAPSPTFQVAAQKAANDIRPLVALNAIEWSQVLDQPLEVEMQSVIRDAKTAIQLVAQNFLPK